MSKIIMLIGIPASGKSRLSRELEEQYNAIVLSSDKLRKELYNDINDVEHNSEVFEELHKRLRSYLKEGKNIIYDATNINAKKRRGLLGQLKGKNFKTLEKICYYLNTDIKTCKQRNVHRDRKVPIEVIDRMYKTLQVPTYNEGWNKINIISNNLFSSLKNVFVTKEILNDLIDQQHDYQTLFTVLKNNIKEFENICEVAQDTPYHTLSISRHIYYVYKYIYDNYSEEDKLIMLWASLLHDIGKLYCKNFKEGSRYANFIGHDNVSSQLTIKILSELKYDTDFILKVSELVQLHMRLSWDNNIKANNKLLNLVDKDTFNKLKIIREADILAK